MPVSTDNCERLAKIYSEETVRPIFFVGAGCSAEVGLPTWFSLREKMFDAIKVRQNQFESGIQNLFDQIVKAYNENDYWAFFGVVEKYEKNLYTDILEEELSHRAPISDIPKVYEYLWKMRHVNQVITTNVDDLVFRSFLESRPGSDVHIYSGHNMVDSYAYIKRNLPTIINLHGTYKQPSDWIMKLADRDRLYQGAGSRRVEAFLSNILSNYAVVFVGFNPMDISISPFLKRFTESGINQKHFWITNRSDKDALTWASNNSVRIIPYDSGTAPNGSETHSAAIIEILEEIEQYVSYDLEPVIPSQTESIDPKTLPGPGSLTDEMSEDRQEAIRLLNGVATYFALTPSERTAATNFFREYEIPIQMAHAVGKQPGYDKIFDYQLVDRISHSASSQVWMVSSEAAQVGGEQYCVAKVFNSHNVTNDSERLSFRRGIESLYLLSKEGIQVAPEYYWHSEVPMCVIMQSVLGSPLTELRAVAGFSSVSHGLTIFDKICRAVEECHRSGGAVLHRDLKPSNILVENWFVGYDFDDVDIKLINFDSSWHNRSSGKSKPISSLEVGYYSPQQKRYQNTGSVRTAATDVYMLGMVLYFLIAGEDPPEGGVKTSEWEKEVRRRISLSLREHKLLGSRISDLIVRMTYEDDKLRPDMTEIRGEIDSLINYLNANANQSYSLECVDADIVLEEVVCRTGFDYEWDRDKSTARILTTGEKNLKLSYIQRNSIVKIEFSRSRNEGDPRKGFGVRLNEKVSNANVTLRDAGWTKKQAGQSVVKLFEFEIRYSDFVSSVQRQVPALEAAFGQLLA